MGQSLILMTVSNTLELTGTEEEIARIDEYLTASFKDNSQCLFEFTLNNENFRIPIAQYTGHRCSVTGARKKLVHEDNSSRNTYSERREDYPNEHKHDDCVHRVISEENMKVNAFSYDNAGTSKPKRRVIEEDGDRDPFLDF